MACHIGEPAQIADAMSRIEAAHGRLDILVNNAATNPYFGPVVDADLGAFQKTVDVNIRGFFVASCAAAKLMQKNGGGAIVNIASISGVVPGPNQGIYSITKAAVIGMTKVFAAECAAMGVRVNAVLPGITETKFTTALVEDEALLGHYLEHVPMKRVAQPHGDRGRRAVSRVACGELHDGRVPAGRRRLSRQVADAERSCAGRVFARARARDPRADRGRAAERRAIESRRSGCAPTADPTSCASSRKASSCPRRTPWIASTG